MKFNQNLNFYGFSTPFSGYGKVAQEYAAALNRQTDGKVFWGWQRPEANSSIPEYKIIRPDIRELIYEKPFQKGKVGIIKTPPPFFAENHSDVRIGYTMVENTRVGQDWIDICNGMDGIFVPSEYLINVFKESGLRTKIFKIKQGVSPEQYPFKERVRKNTFKFGICGWMDDRKNWKELAIAFTSEFSPEEPVELIIKNGNDTFGFDAPFDTRIKIIDERWTDEEMLAFYHDLDCFVFPSRAEGAGMPPREAMSTGLPVIMTNWSGLADICDDKYNYSLTPVAIDIPDGRNDKSQPGFQARIDIQELMYYMRYCYENWEEAMIKGKQASMWMAREWNWDLCATEMLDILVKNFGYE